jgi:hypothetical protein
MISLETLRNKQDVAEAMAADLGLVVRKLGDKELQKFGLSFERQFVVPFLEREDVIKDIYLRHMEAILLGAMVAKEQMDAEIDGTIPQSGKIGGPLPIRAAWLGIGADWDDVGSITTGSPQNWIHSGTTLMGGTAGNPVKIGGKAVHVVIAIGSYHPSPKIESIKFEIDGKEKPIIQTGWAQRYPGSVKITELDKEFVFKKGTTILAKVFASATLGSTVNDIPYLLGASFVLEDVLRIQDPANIPGTVADVILVT